MRCWPDAGKAARRRSRPTTRSPPGTPRHRLARTAGLLPRLPALARPICRPSRRPGSRRRRLDVAPDSIIDRERRRAARSPTPRPSRPPLRVVDPGPSQLLPVTVRLRSSTSESRTVCACHRNTATYRYQAASLMHIRKASSTSSDAPDLHDTNPRCSTVAVDL